MEDYKEKYEEAKEIMLEFVRRGSITMDLAKVIFPELGESDDDIEKSKNLDFLPPDGKPKQLNLERLVCDFLSFYPDEETKRRYMELGRYNQKQNIAINYIRDALKHAVGQQGMEYKDGRLVPIEHERFNIKEGTWYVCIKDGIFGGYPDGDTNFHKGEVYYCDAIGIVDHNSDNLHEDFKTGKEKVWDYFRPWNIQDAKPGDVLCYTNGEWVFIYKEKDDTVIKYHALLSERGFFVNDAACIVLDCCLAPATKAQRDFLFYRLQESGYRWNEETLKLEKTEEEKPAATEKEPSEQQPAMIKASELMLGDWLRHAGTGELMQVTRIDAIRGGGHFACGSPHCWEYNNRFEPVPLTAEILEKNGFEYHSGERGMYGVTTANYYAIEGSPHIFCDGDPFAVWFEDEVPIRYVHELQLVLRLCGIEKDIEL